MAAFRRSGTKNYWIGPFRAGVVDVPRMTTGQKNKATAKAMEDALKNRAVTGYTDLVQQVADKVLPLVEFYTAHIEGPEQLDRLRSRAGDPLLSAAVEEYRPRVSDRRVEIGLDQLLALAPEGARLSYLQEPQSLQQLYQDGIAGVDRLDEEGRPIRRAPNTVRRGLHRAVAELLTYKLGRGSMLAVMAEVKKPSANDERHVMLSLDEIRHALELADVEFRPILGLALTTGIDTTPLLRIRDSDYNPDEGTLRVTDTKTASRPRTLLLRGEPVLENAEHWLSFLRVWVNNPSELLVPLTVRQIRSRWEALRAEIGRPEVRWKDLRGIFATYYLQAGGDPRILQDVLGHATMTMTLRYLKRLPVGSRRHVSESAKTMGLPAPRLTVEKGGAA